MSTVNFKIGSYVLRETELYRAQVALCANRIVGGEGFSAENLEL